MTRYDVIVVGQGLAGTALAWCLRWRGRRVAVIDDDTPATASRVAAGLITPVTGSRLTTTPNFDLLRDAAIRHYRRTATDSRSDAHILNDPTCCRLFATAAERDAFANKPTPHARLARPDELPNPDWFTAPAGGFVMPSALRVDVPTYLTASRRAFDVLDGRVCPETDVTINGTSVSVPKFDVVADHVVFCTGLGSRSDPWFGRLRFEPARGEVLTLDVPDLDHPGTVHTGVWLTPLGRSRFLCGSTYDRTDLTASPTATGRAEIETKLRAFLRLPYTVTGHAAAVRPITPTRRPVLGRHPATDRVWVFTGLSSKGALYAPHYADQLAAAVCGVGVVDAGVDVRRLQEFAR